MLRFICLLFFTFSISPSFSQDVEDEYMIELAKDLFLGLPIQSNFSNSLSLLNESDQVSHVTLTGDGLKAVLINHPILDIPPLQEKDGIGEVCLEILFKNDRIFERRILVKDQSNLKAFNTLYNLLKTASFHTEIERSVVDSSYYHQNTLFFTALDGRNLAHIELSYNPKFFDSEKDLIDPKRTIGVVLAIYDDTLY